MVEKFLVSTFKKASGVVYILIFLFILSLPCIFIYEAFQPPQFIFDSVSINEDMTEDSVLSDEEKAEKWTRIDFSMTATARKLSPYSFYIEKFTLAGDIPIGDEDVKIVLDHPIEFTKDTSSPFTLTLYIKGERDINEIVKRISFKAADYERSFGEFRLKFVDSKVTFRK